MFKKILDEKYEEDFIDHLLMEFDSFSLEYERKILSLGLTSILKFSQGIDILMCKQGRIIET